jgi:hypothetical protein
MARERPESQSGQLSPLHGEKPFSHCKQNLTRRAIRLNEKTVSHTSRMISGIFEHGEDREQAEADSIRFKNLEPASNVKCESFAEPLKHDSEIASKDEGMPIDSSEAQPSNVDFSRIETL